MSDLISIVIPTYNRCNELKRALDSVLSQSYKNWEVIAVDNDSVDNTDAMLESLNDSRIQLLKINNHGVIAASRNMGIKASNGKWIAFLDSDDWWHPNKLEKVMEYCKLGYDVCYHDLLIAKKLNFFKKRLKGRQVQSPVFNDLIQLGNAITNSSAVVKASLIKQIDGLCEDKGLIAAEDYECWLRLSKLTDKFKYIPKTLGYYWLGDENTTSPKLSLIHLQYINQRYIIPFIEEDDSNVPAWWVYAYARALYLTGDTTNARGLLQELVKRRIAFFLRVKAYYMLYSKRHYN